ncbi:MAG: hypothetical protein HY553_00905 [Elusimicrobia bacterium]|nr:hypothetical protein [Elusimicrobiota bacterium]
MSVLLGRAAVPLLAALLLPAPATADCILHLRCVAASRVPSQSKRFADRASCMRVVEQGKAYSGCDYSCQCSGESSGAGMAPMSPDQYLMRQTMQQLSLSLGQAIGAALAGGSPQERRRRAAEEAALLEEEERRAREAEAERKRRFEADKEELLSGFKGASAAADLGFKGSDPEDHELKFKEYHERETQRREVIDRVSREAVTALENSVRDWCKLHPVLYPTRSAYADGQEYEEKLSSYEARHKVWLDYCNQDFKKALPLIDAAGGDAKGVELLAHSDCFGAFKKQSEACSGHSTNLKHLDCLNAELQNLAKCKGRPAARAPAPTDYLYFKNGRPLNLGPGGRPGAISAEEQAKADSRQALGPDELLPREGLKFADPKPYDPAKDADLKRRLNSP